MEEKEKGLYFSFLVFFFFFLLLSSPHFLNFLCCLRNKLVEQTALECKKRAGGDLEHFLIMPVQRIPRYNLLLNDLLKNTSSGNYSVLKYKYSF